MTGLGSGALPMACAGCLLGLVHHPLVPPTWDTRSSRSFKLLFADNNAFCVLILNQENLEFLSAARAAPISALQLQNWSV